MLSSPHKMFNFKRFPLKGGINGAGLVLRKSWCSKYLQQMQPTPLGAIDWNMTRPIFYFEGLKNFDKLSILLYLTITFGLLYYCWTTNDNGNKNSLIFGYGLLTQLFLYGYCYKSLRNLTVFFIWILIERWWNITND